MKIYLSLYQTARKGGDALNRKINLSIVSEKKKGEYGKGKTNSKEVLL